MSTFQFTTNSLVIDYRYRAIIVVWRYGVHISHKFETNVLWDSVTKILSTITLHILVFAVF